MSELTNDVRWVEKALNFLSVETQLIMSGRGHSDVKKFHEVRSMVMNVIHFRIKEIDKKVKLGGDM